MALSTSGFAQMNGFAVGMFHHDSNALLVSILVRKVYTA
jgi:hypothetical protein